MSSVRNRKAKDREKRAKLRRRLLAQGVDEATIDKIIEVRRRRDLDARHRTATVRTREEILANTDDRLWPDDTGYKPTAGDPLLRGAARVDGVTAKVVRRRNTITRFQYGREVEGHEAEGP